MPWSILWTDQAVRDLSRIDPPIARRIVRKVESAAANPLRFFSRLVAADEYKLRVGDYRLLAALDGGSETILIERVDHRSRIYERRK
ncbi:MAG: type II toxin-antitoxin system RelE/ParE family toxin [Methanobacteriota archaeon]|nr:MAG: type II toxin-antitoxin system RelE/ParE family toxin [Euryarchaeota archaeon]